jgi:signal transduction histidine kinase
MADPRNRGETSHQALAVTNGMSLKARDSSFTLRHARHSTSLRQSATVSKTTPLTSSFIPSVASSALSSSSATTRSISPQNQRLLAALVRKYHELVVEFDARWKVVSIWSSNFNLPIKPRQNLLGQHLRRLVGKPAFQYLLHMHRCALRDPGTAPATINFHATLDGKSGWFDAAISCASKTSGRPSRGVLRVVDVSKRHATEIRLHNCETLLEHAEETAEMGTWEYDPVARRSTWSKQLYRLHNLEPLNRPLTEHEIWRIINFKNRRQLRRDFRLTLGKGVPFRYTEAQPQPDGSIRILMGIGAPVLNSAGKVIRVVGVTRDITSQVRTLSDVRSLSHKLLTVRGEEQRRMGRDLHETTSQTLAALKMTLAQIGRSVPADNHKVLKLLRSSSDLASAAVREVRLVSSLLYPPLLKEAGLPAALASYTKLFSDRSGIAVALRLARDFGRLNSEMELTAFRIIQEALTNVHRHAHASTATVRVERSQNTLFVAIKDNGVGVPDSRAQPSAKIPLGVGIAGMRERIDQLHGQFKFISTAGKGTLVWVSIPIPRRKEAPNEHQTGTKRSRRTKALPYSAGRRSRHCAPGNSRTARA